MKSPVRIALASIVAAAAVVPLAVQRSAAPASVTEAASRPAEDVRVEHELVVVDPPAPKAAPPAQARPVAAAGQRPERFAAKARTALLGDGRHKPQPFPRVR